jgi:hypothetical protein
MPPAVVITLSFALPFKTTSGTLDVPEEDKIIRTVAIDRTRKPAFTLAPFDVNQPLDANMPVDANEVPDVNQPADVIEPADTVDTRPAERFKPRTPTRRPNLRPRGTTR